MKKVLRIGVVTAIPTPYRDPFWEVFSQQAGIELEVIYCARSKGDRPWDISWSQNFCTHYPKSYNFARKFGEAASLYWNPELPELLRSQRYDALLIGGYNHLTLLWSIVWSKVSKTPYYLMSESYLEQSRATWKKVFKEWFVRFIVKNAQGGLPTGTLAAEYLVHYGANPEAICHVPNVPDVEAFQKKSAELVNRRVLLRRELGLNRFTILFVGRFIPMKGGDLLIRAFAAVHKQLDAELVMLGDGPERITWERLAQALGVEAQVKFLGFQQPDQITSWFSVADLMCLPSKNETWSVVVLEALASNLPVLITDRVGCYRDAVNDEVGTVVRANSVDALEEGLMDAVRNKRSREFVSENWAMRRRKFRYEAIASELRGFLLRTSKKGT